MVGKSLIYRPSGRKEQHVVIPDVDHQEAVSIVSLPTDRSDRIKVLNKWNEDRKKAEMTSSNDSVLSDVTFSDATFSMKKPQKPASNTSVREAFGHDFILECENGERIFVPSMQGMLIKSHCRHIRKCLEGHTTKFIWGDEKDSNDEEGVITKKTWSPRTARHMIELLAEGTSWIENDMTKFVDLLRACDEVNVRLHLSSPINFHDVLDPSNSLQFFKLRNEKKYRFQLAGCIQSRQWMNLIQSGILLHMDSKVLMVSARSSPGKHENSEATLGRRQRRLMKCDNLYSEFKVYSNRSSINALYTILGVLSTTAKQKSKLDKKISRNKVPEQPDNFDESIQLVCKTLVGGLSENELNMFWRMTSASYTLSTPSEERLLQSANKPEVRCTNIGNLKICKRDPLAPSSASTAVTEMTGQTELTDHDELTHTDTSSHQDKADVAYENRTMTGTSFVALKHMFDPINRSSSEEPSINDPSLLPACLSISNPTPDTLGRFLNACATAPSKEADGEAPAAPPLPPPPKIGFDIIPSSSPSNGKGTMKFFVSNTSKRIREILDSMADYSGTSAVGEAEFRLEQLRHA